MTIHHVFAIAGAKGGVGKTTTAINLGAALAEQGASVVVVETDLAMANVVDFLDLDLDLEADPTLHDVLAGRSRLSAAVYRAPAGIDVVPSGVALDGYVAASPELIEEVVTELRKRYNVVILDTPAGVSRETLLPLKHADDTVLVSTPRVASVRDAEKTKQLAERVGGRVAGIVFTMTGPGRAPDADRIARYVGVPLLGHVPEDEAVPESQDLSVPVLTHRPDAPAAVAYRAVAEELSRHIVAHRGDESAPEPAEGRAGGVTRRSSDHPGDGEPAGDAETAGSGGDDATTNQVDPVGGSPRPEGRDGGPADRGADRARPGIRPPAATDGSGLTADADAGVGGRRDRDGGGPDASDEGPDRTTTDERDPAGGEAADAPSDAVEGETGPDGPDASGGRDTVRAVARSLRRRLGGLLSRSRSGPVG